MRLILGSQSPRRKEILAHFHLPFEQFSSSFVEESVPFLGNPEAYALTISQGKSQALSPLFPEAIILTADTVVFRQGKVYGKPKDKEESFAFLRELAGQWHSVYTAVTVRNRNQVFSAVEETKVLLNALTDKQINTYQETVNCFDKAAGYAIQLPGSLIVQRIDGCFFNAMGLPINTLRILLGHLGIDLWEYLNP